MYISENMVRLTVSNEYITHAELSMTRREGRKPPTSNMCGMRGMAVDISIESGVLGGQDCVGTPDNSLPAVCERTGKHSPI